ncbi:hypothetical protein F1544_13640 [Kineosporiaceae bacterium B12]|nr:phosphotransferase [Kineococcus rubinsiae]NIZ92029.1 hypothetical protein [Kineococcus rubinsiae]
MLRLGKADSAADPRRAQHVLRSLELCGVDGVPRIVDAGSVEGLGWTAETLLPGHRPRQLGKALVRDIATFLSGLPTSTVQFTARTDAEVLARAHPNRRAQLLDVADRLADHPLAANPVVRHGDLWLGNCLRDRRGRLSGVVDWDASTPAGLPGADLLHLIATDVRLRRRSSLGDVWRTAPWEGAAFLAPAQSQWPQWAHEADARRAVGTSWWLSQVAADLNRAPQRASDVRWWRSNVASVLDAVAR